MFDDLHLPTGNNWKNVHEYCIADHERKLKKSTSTKDHYPKVKVDIETTQVTKYPVSFAVFDLSSFSL